MANPIFNASTSRLAERTGRRLLRGALAGFASALALAIAPAAHAQTACDADINADGVVDSSDLGAVLSGWGAYPDCVSDLNDDGVVDSSDLGALLSLWGCGVHSGRLGDRHRVRARSSGRRGSCASKRDRGLGLSVARA